MCFEIENSCYDAVFFLSFCISFDKMEEEYLETRTFDCVYLVIVAVGLVLDLFFRPFTLALLL